MSEDEKDLETLQMMQEFYRYALQGTKPMPKIIPDHPYPCSWWIEPRCSLNSTYLILMACEEGHIRERILCEGHHNTAVDFIDKKLMHCAECERMLTRHMSKHPIENTWDLEQTLQDTEAIITVFFNDHRTTAPWTLQGPSIPPYTGYPGKYNFPQRTFPGIPIDNPKKPTTKEINDLQEALEQLKAAQKTQQHIKKAMEDLSTPTTNKKTLGWLKKHFPPKP